MAKRRKPTLADHVEALERREAPRAQARAVRHGTWWNVWLILAVLFIVLAAGTYFYLRFKRFI